MADKQKLSVPKVFAWLASILAISVIVAGQLLPQGEHSLLRIVGVSILIPAVIFIFLPFSQLAKHGNKNKGDHYMQANQVANHGLYAFIRHPQYLGYNLLTAGFAFIAQHRIVYLLAAVSCACFVVQAILEEQYCKEKFGRPYIHYLQKVPQFNLLLALWLVVRGPGND